MRLPAFHLFVWILLYQHLSTCTEFKDQNRDLHFADYGTAFFYYNQEARLQILEDIDQALSARYALLEIKQQRLGIDIRELFDQAVKTEFFIEDVSAPVLQAKSNLDFLDRMKRLIAKFKDTHLQLHETIELPEVYTGLKVALIDHRLYIIGIENKLSKYLRKLEVDLEIGDEIVEIDGQSIHRKIGELEIYVSGSSDIYRKKIAADATMKRSFRYPKDRMATLKIKRRTIQTEYLEIQLPWYTNMKSLRPDVALYFQDIHIVYRPEGEYSGGEINDAPLGMRNIQEWNSSENPDQLVYRTGYLQHGNQPVGVLQLFSFYALEVMNSNDQRIESWESPLIDFITNLKDQEIPLILDLRWNEGGHTFLADTMIQILGRTSESYASFTEAFRMTPSIRQMWQGKEKTSTLYSAEDQAIRYVNEAALNGRAHTFVWAHSEPLVPHPDVGGFNEDTLVLISPFCISACELLAMMFQFNHRAKLLGSFTNGTGGAFFEWQPFTGVHWSDRYEVIRINIPNYLVGKPGRPGVNIFPEPNAYLTYNHENLPLQADHYYAETLEDYLKRSTGWFRTATNVLVKPLKTFESH